MVAMELTAIGHVTSARRDPVDDDWDGVACSITLDGEVVGEEALAGLDAFSHVEVLFVFHGVDEAGVERGRRRPRGNPGWPEVGILAQRARMRPNRLGSTVCQLLAVDGRTLQVAGLDAIDGTPVVDVKPYLAELAPRGPVHQPAWSHELMAGYWRAAATVVPGCFVQGLRFELFVSDVARSMTFYEDVLGFAADPDADPAGYVPVTNGRATIGLQRQDALEREHHFRRAGAAGPFGVGAELVLEVDDVDAAYARASPAVAAAGGHIEPLVARPWGRRDFRLVDPDGYYLRIT